VADHSTWNRGSGAGPDHFGGARVVRFRLSRLPRPANDNPVPTRRRVRRALWWAAILLTLLAALLGALGV